MEPKILPPAIQEALARLPPHKRNTLCELRFRCGRSVQAVYPSYSESLCHHGTTIPVNRELIDDLVNRVTGFSPNALRNEETGLYLPMPNGCRMGLCGEAVIRDGKFYGLKSISSVVIRFAREVKGVAQTAAQQLLAQGNIPSVLLVSPPGCGKTTFLRDLIRVVSDRGYRIAVVDERREIAAVKNAIPQLDVGTNTDVLSGCGKVEGIPLLLRVMNPQVIAVDELSGEQEAELVEKAAESGVSIFATVHGNGIASLYRHPVYRKLLHGGSFEWCISLNRIGEYRMERLTEHAEICGSRLCNTGVAFVGDADAPGASSQTAAASQTAVGAGTHAGGNGTPYVLCG